ncbi:MAG: PLP-dependent aminotransferase family protein, partial [Acidobacteriota bacterium]|nr:PLP-dependent aminotransferase family protein [Acidobacteriota bacterium]
MNNIETVLPGSLSKLANWTNLVPESPLQSALMLSGRPEVLSLALGLPAPELFPHQEFSAACSAVLASDGHALQYGKPPDGLKTHIVNLMRERGVNCSEGEVFLTFGAQQALRLAVALILDEGQPVITEELSYPGFQQVAQFYSPEFLTVPTDPATGMDVERVERYLKSGIRPSLIYAIPDGHNPLGVTLSVEKRKRLCSIAQHYGIRLLEEDPYGLLTYSDEAPAPLRSYNDDVLYIGSFSKLLAPSVRVGWLLAPERCHRYLGILKEASDINTATFAQRVVNQMLSSGFLNDHLARLRREYR